MACEIWSAHRSFIWTVGCNFQDFTVWLPFRLHKIKTRRMGVIPTVNCHRHLGWTIFSLHCSTYCYYVLGDYLPPMVPSEDLPRLYDHMSPCPWGRRRIIRSLLNATPLSNWYCWLVNGALSKWTSTLCNAEKIYWLCKCDWRWCHCCAGTTILTPEQTIIQFYCPLLLY